MAGAMALVDVIVEAKPDWAIRCNSRMRVQWPRGSPDF